MPGRTSRKAIRLTQEELMALVAGRSDTEIAAHIRGLAAAHRPPRLINNDTVLNMAEWGCSLKQIAASQGITARALEQRLKKDKHFAELIEMGRDRGDAKLLGVGFREAMKGNMTARIWLGKQRLHERENWEITGAGGGPIQVEHSVKPDFSRLSLEEKRQLLMGLQKVIAPPVSHANGHAANSAATYEVIDAEIVEDSAA